MKKNRLGCHTMGVAPQGIGIECRVHPTPFEALTYKNLLGCHAMGFEDPIDGERERERE